MRLIETIRKKNRVMAERATTSRKAAIRLFCLECMGGSSKEVSGCETRDCPLHPFRLGKIDRGDGATELEPGACPECGSYEGDPHADDCPTHLDDPERAMAAWREGAMKAAL